MNHLRRWRLLATSVMTVFTVTLAAAVSAAGSLQPANLRCESRQDPVGLDVVQPRLSWTLDAPPDARDQTQSAYQVLVASTPETLAADQGDLWDSGKVASDQTIHVVYAGKPLASRLRVWWKARVWDQDQRPSGWSKPATWKMGLLQSSDWQAQWIADPDSATNIVVRGPLNGYHSEIAKTADTAKWVTVDLGQPQSFDAVRLFPARPYDWQPDTPGFLYPLRFKFEAASREDFSDARVLLDRTAADEPNPGTNAPTYKLASTTARFVRLAATQLRQRDDQSFAFALAEMQVLSGGTNLAESARVLALDSIETAAWAKTHLTDGVEQTIQPESAGALPATLVRNSFTLPQTSPLRRATAYVTALGLYELQINGRRVGEQLLAPEWTSYRQRVAYQTYDVTSLLQPGWTQPGFDDRAWSRAKAFDRDDRKLVWLRNEPIQVTEELTPIQLTEPEPGVFVFDLGQNMVGWCRIEAIGAAGQTVTIRHAEMLNDDGTLYTANLRAAPQINRYTPREAGRFVFEPRFTYQGFRYVELTGLAEPPTTAAVLGRVFHSTSPLVGRFECSDPSLNQLMQNILWTQRANLMSSPNDCPQRDERFGWMGDIQVFAQTASFNMDMAAFFTKFAQDIRDDQADDGRFPDFAPHPGDPNKAFSGAPAWADAGVIVPWRAYQNYADTRVLADHFDAARRWVDYVHRHNPDLIWSTNRHNDYNDWLNGNWVKQAGWPSQGGSVSNDVFATAFFAHSTELVSKMAGVLGRNAEARRYGDLFEQIKTRFNERFVAPDGRIESDTQGGYALALNFDLLSDDLRPAAARHLVDNVGRYQNHLSTGIQTTHRAMFELTRHGHTDLAWQLLTFGS